MGEDVKIHKSGRWIPSGVGPAEGWHIRNKFEVDGVLCIAYDIEGDDWLPRPVRDVSLPVYKPPKRRINWEEQPLGEVTDAELAKELGVSVKSVFCARKKRGIPATRERRNPLDVDWDAQPLGKESDVVIANRLRVDPTTVTKARKKRGIKSIYVDWDSQPLGEVTDAELARQLGVDPSTVGKARRSRGIKGKLPYKKIDWTREPLGEISDGDIARALGVSQPRVTKARNALGIPPFDRQRASEG
jgi:hypothetical protein